MKTFTVPLSVLFFIPNISIATEPITQREEDRKPGIQVRKVSSQPITITQEEEDRETPSEDHPNSLAINLQKDCQYFLRTGLENDNWAVIQNGNDEGYTHGHLTHITKSCDSGMDINIAMDSRLFTEHITTRKTRKGDIKIRSRFEEENKLTVEQTNWRGFDELYRRAGLTIGHRSRNKLGLAGKEHKLFHNSLSSLDYGEDDAQLGDTVTGIFRYEYIPEDENNTFIGGHIAFGKSYSLDNLKETCTYPCVDYFRTEAGVEMISLKHGSNIYILSEIDKAIPHPWDALSVFASLKAQKHKDTDGIYSEGSVGLKLRASRFQLHYLIKKRHLPHKGTWHTEYDRDGDHLVFVGVEIPLY